MKKIVFLLLIVPATVFCQSRESINAFRNSIPENLGRPVTLPQRGYGTPISQDDSFSYKKRQNIFVINSDSVYRLVFWNYRYTKDSLRDYIRGNDSSLYKFMLRYLVDSLPVFDFSKVELVLYYACGQCLAFCDHHGEKQEPCHRNACSFMDAWFVREKQPALTQINKIKL